jgi:xylulokinase
MSLLLCTDLGTSVCKSVIYDLEFHAKGRGYAEIPTRFPRPRWAEQEPEDWWSAACATIRKAIKVSGMGPKDIAGVAVCGQGHGPVLLDARGVALLPCIIWPDLRAIAQAEYINARLRRKVAAYYTAPKMLWIKENHPGAFGRMHKFVLPKDYVRLRLTDEILTDEGDAGGTMMYSCAERAWDRPLVELIGIPREKLPDVLPADRVVGKVTRRAAADAGLRAATPVIAGSGDYICTELALGDLLRPRRAAIYLGSAPSIFTMGEDGQLKGGFMGIGGASLKWFKELCGRRVTYEALDKEAEAVEPGAGGLLFLPHMMGERNPTYNPHAQGVLFGLSLGHGRGAVVRCIMEGVALQLKYIWNGLQGIAKLDEILVLGGGARSPVWTQVIADVFGVDVGVPKMEEVGTLGLALLLSTGLGIYGDIAEARKRVNPHIVRRVSSRDAHHRRYDEMFRLYCELEDALMKF